MKYINDYIKESNDLPILIDFKEQTDMYLAYLTDEGYVIDTNNSYVNSHVNNELYSIMIYKPSTSGASDNDTFSWNDINNYLLPYLEILKEKFYFNIYVYNYFRRSSSTLTMEQIFNDNLDGLMNDIHTFTIKIYPKKNLNKLQKFGNFIKNKMK